MREKTFTTIVNETEAKMAARPATVFIFTIISRPALSAKNSEAKMKVPVGQGAHHFIGIETAKIGRA